ncbi:Lrp/AsnC family transcriptional regulator [Ascidiimonas sp. W6]|uniref:Lrp/AsnC family transcriptional regulator n=1 Tax=Ascidiimonas meishanensis TaxID=3128903 RepID=UPI0030EF6601
MKLDSIDKQLLELLQTYSKRTHKELANRCGLSVTAVYERIRRLEREGIIKSYVAILDKKKIKKSFTVLCHIKLVKHTKEYVTLFEKEVLKLQEVSECFHVSGDYDYILKVHVEHMEAYREFMISKLTVLKHIGSTQSSFSIKEVKCTTVIDL